MLYEIMHWYKGQLRLFVIMFGVLITFGYQSSTACGDRQLPFSYPQDAVIDAITASSTIKLLFDLELCFPSTEKDLV